jgi:hypothetical protein
VKPFLALLLSIRLCAEVVKIRPDGVFEFAGRPAFPIGFTTAPDPAAKAPSGQNAYAELVSNGLVFSRCGLPGKWSATSEAVLDVMLDRAAATGPLCAIYIPDLAVIKPGEVAKEMELRRVVNKYKRHRAVAFWKGADEPEWGKIPVQDLEPFYRIVHELDPDHPVWITQAPRGSIESLRRYKSTYDVGAIDIYPVSYPPGLHSDLPNKNLGDYASRIAQANEGEKPFWMVLQICFSGVTKPGKTLRFPTFAEQRYMSYQSIIAGARGLLYFGGNVEACWNDRDRALGWNWSFYNKVLKPVLDELNPKSPLYPALIAPDSRLPVHVEGGPDVEFRARETAEALFILAAKREGQTMQVTFRGLPNDIHTGDLLYEEPRKVTVQCGSFTDWFGPNEVHAYRFGRLQVKPSEERGAIRD